MCWNKKACVRQERVSAFWGQSRGGGCAAPAITNWLERGELILEKSAKMSDFPGWVEEQT